MRLHVLTAGLLSCALLLSHRAAAEATYSGEVKWGSPIVYFEFHPTWPLTVISTSLDSRYRNADTVLLIYKKNKSGSLTYVSGNDDTWGLRSSQVWVWNWTVFGQDTYVAIVRARDNSAAGVTTVSINGTKRFTNVPFGGYKKKASWNATEVARATMTTPADRQSPSYAHASIIMAGGGETSNVEIAVGGGPNASAMLPLTKSVTNGFVVAGQPYYVPGKGGVFGSGGTELPGGHVTIDAPTANSSCRSTLGNDRCLDTDGDGLSDKLENLIAPNAWQAPDVDSDGILDSLEFYGNDTFTVGSFNGVTGASPAHVSFCEYGDMLTRDLYVAINHVKVLNDPEIGTVDWLPDSRIPAAAEEIFAQDSGTGSSKVRAHMFLQPAIELNASTTPAGAIFWDMTGTVPAPGVCTDQTRCSTFSAQIGGTLSNEPPLMATHFHNALFAGKILVNPGESAQRGVAERPGKLFLVGVDSVVPHDATTHQPQIADPATEQVFASELAVFIHELGHNLGLTHNDNDAMVFNSSTHVSVMNYKYSNIGGIPYSGAASQKQPNVSPPRRATYSHGTGGTTACNASTKSGYIGCRRYPKQKLSADLQAKCKTDPQLPTDPNVPWGTWVTYFGPLCNVCGEHVESIIDDQNQQLFSDPAAPIYHNTQRIDFWTALWPNNNHLSCDTVGYDSDVDEWSSLQLAP